MRRKKDNPLTDLRAYRMSRNANQTEFWGRFGVTQSAGSRYESGRELPAPTAMLVLAFADGLINEIALARLRKIAL